MTVNVHIFPNEQLLLKIPDDIEVTSVGNNQILSHKEFKVALERLNALVKKIDGPDAQPLSDNAMSRESIYENYPKL